MKPSVTLGDISVLVLILAAGSFVRLVHVSQIGLPTADPWRHMALVRNIQDGVGFTLFCNQPYIWYSSLWYYIAAFLVSPQNLKWLSAVTSLLCLPVFGLYLYKRLDGDRAGFLCGTFLFSVFGPLVVFTCQLGSEAFATFLLLSALVLLVSRTGPVAAFGGGLLFGLCAVARMNFVFNGFLFWPTLKSKLHFSTFIAGLSIPLLAHWFRNHQVILKYDYLFTWDGLATKTSDYNLLSTILPQLHPAVKQGLYTLHSNILEIPQWLYFHDRFRWEIICFLLIAVSCVVLSRKIELIAAAGLTLCYFAFFDSTLSARFFRVWLCLFPVFIIGIAEIASRFGNSQSRTKRVAVVALTVGIALTGISELKPVGMLPIEVVTPPAELLTQDKYMVNSGFYHPESLLYRYPSKSFIGMPLYAAQFDEFSSKYKDYDWIIWRSSFSVQSELSEFIRDNRRFYLVEEKMNPGGLPYQVFKRP